MGFGGPRAGLRPAGQRPTDQRAWGRPPASAALRQSALAAGKNDPGVPYREALIMQALLNHPWLLDEQAEEISSLTLTSPALARLRNAMLSLCSDDNSLDSQSLRSQVQQLNLGKVIDLIARAITHKCDRFAEPDADRAEVDAGWRHALALHERQLGLCKALDAAEQDWHETTSEDAFARIREIKSLITSSDALDAPIES